mgnify:CR=1 FL=1
MLSVFEKLKLSSHIKGLKAEARKMDNSMQEWPMQALQKSLETINCHFLEYIFGTPLMFSYNLINFIMAVLSRVVEFILS